MKTILKELLKLFEILKINSHYLKSYSYVNLDKSIISGVWLIEKSTGKICLSKRQDQITDINKVKQDIIRVIAQN